MPTASRRGTTRRGRRREDQGARRRRPSNPVQAQVQFVGVAGPVSQPLHAPSLGGIRPGRRASEPSQSWSTPSSATSGAPGKRSACVSSQSVAFGETSGGAVQATLGNRESPKPSPSASRHQTGASIASLSLTPSQSSSPSLHTSVAPGNRFGSRSSQSRQAAQASPSASANCTNASQSKSWGSVQSGCPCQPVLPTRRAALTRRVAPAPRRQRASVEGAAPISRRRQRHIRAFRRPNPTRIGGFFPSRPRRYRNSQRRWSVRPGGR